MTTLYEQLDERTRTLTDAIVQILKWVPDCNCSKKYTKRNLIDPGCEYHQGHWGEVNEIGTTALEKFMELSTRTVNHDRTTTRI